MDAQTIRDELAAIEERYGPWTAHNIRLTDDVYTMGETPAGDEVKLRRVAQIVADVCGNDFTGMRVLDLACLEGMYGLELASRGASVLAIEGREANLEKARFAARVHGIDRIEFELGDVRALNRERHGEFDVVLCLGIFYHLDADDLFDFVSRMRDVTKRALIVDTAVSLSGKETRVLGGHTYEGETLFEHDPSSSSEERLKAVWSSLDNPSAFSLTLPSLLRLLARAGFTSVYECGIPAESGKSPHRVTLLALSGTPVTHLVTPEPTEDPADVPERAPLGARLPHARSWDVGRKVVPRPLRSRVRRLLGAETRRH